MRKTPLSVKDKSKATPVDAITIGMNLLFGNRYGHVIRIRQDHNRRILVDFHPRQKSGSYNVDCVYTRKYYTFDELERI